MLSTYLHRRRRASRKTGGLTARAGIAWVFTRKSQSKSRSMHHCMAVMTRFLELFPARSNHCHLSRGLMVRDGASAPPHHVGRGACGASVSKDEAIEVEIALGRPDIGQEGVDLRAQQVRL